ncbi:MAG: tetratricopeptide repeat protein [Sedimentisphaerales bacterium]|nr:tetratricopeptide repeat protein [Sedimentisphaerales bacterium]
MNKVTEQNLTFCIIAALVLATVAVFYEVYSYDFVNYDDPGYVLENTEIQKGVTPETIKWALTTDYFSYWHPLTWLSHALDWQLYKDNPAGHHITSLLFHIANAILLFIVLKQMTGAIWPSAFVAGLFAVHPLHVESVAWVTERKDVLSHFFWLLTMWAYVGYVRRSKVTSYLLVVMFFGFAVMAKPMVVTLPFALLLLDYWPLKRLNSGRSFVRLVIEKIPLFIIILGVCVLTVVIQKKVGAVRSTADFGLVVRFANAAISYVRYIGKMFWPFGLTMAYPHAGENISLGLAAAAGAGLLVVTVIILLFSKNHRYLFTGWFWFLGTLVPVIGIVQVGEQAMADRYSYITLTGLFIIIAWGIPELLGKWSRRKTVLWVVSIAVLAGLALRAHFQQKYWKDTITLCEHALAVTDDNYQAHFCIVPPLVKQGRMDEAIWHSEKTVRIQPNNPSALNGHGMILQQAGRVDEAIGYYKKAIEIDPEPGSVHSNIGLALVSKGRLKEAAEHCRIAAEKLDNITAHNTYAYVLLNLGRFSEAVAEYRKVYSAMPDNPTAVNALVYALVRNGQYDEAISLCNQVLLRRPELVEVRLNLGFALASGGRFDEAIREYKQILLIQPRNAAAYNDLGTVFLRQNRFDDAIANFNQAIRINPNYADAKANLAYAVAEKEKLKK